jgi:hypothetical protein
VIEPELADPIARFIVELVEMIVKLVKRKRQPKEPAPNL